MDRARAHNKTLEEQVIQTHILDSRYRFRHVICGRLTAMHGQRELDEMLRKKNSGAYHILTDSIKKLIESYAAFMDAFPQDAPGYISARQSVSNLIHNDGVFDSILLAEAILATSKWEDAYFGPAKPVPRASSDAA